MKQKIIFNGFVLGQRPVWLKIFYLILFTIFLPLFIFSIIFAENVFLITVFNILFYPLLSKMFRKYIEIYEDKCFGVYIYFLGLKFGKIYKLPEINFVYLIRTNTVGKYLGQNYYFGTGFRTQFEVLRVFDIEKNVIFTLSSIEESYINKKAFELSKIFNINIQDYRGREMEIYRYSDMI